MSEMETNPKRLRRHPPDRMPLTRRGALASLVGAAVAPHGLDGDQGKPPSPGVPWLAEVQRPPAKLPADAPRLTELLVGRRGRPIKTRAGWRRRRRELLRAWRTFLGPAPYARRTVPRLEVLATDRRAGVVRQRVRYQVEPGEWVEAYLLKPLEVSEPRPGVAVFHSTVAHSILQPAGLEGRPEMAFGLKLARRGYVALCPRNYLWPTNHEIQAQQQAQRFLERHPRCKGMARMLADARLTIDLLASLPEVDVRRLGSVGHSLGAKEVLYLAAFDERVKVTISSEGGIGTRFSNWDAPWYLGPDIGGEDFPREHHELLALAAPRPFLLVGGDSADGDRSWPFIEAVLPLAQLYGSPLPVGLFNHRQGHAVPPLAERRIAEWFDRYL